MMVLCLPTPFDFNISRFNCQCIIETCAILSQKNYDGLVVIKSTIEPGTIDSLSTRYKLKLFHNPEFLTSATAEHDFHHQKHIVIGNGPNCSDQDLNRLETFYQKYYPSSSVSVCNALESESMKLAINSFYAIKIQFFNEIFQLCQKLNIDYEIVKDLMIKNEWINSMHTNVPGPDGKLSYGGGCFPKDTNALLAYLQRNNLPHQVLQATCQEQHTMRELRVPATSESHKTARK